MKRADIKRINAMADRAMKLSGQYQVINNPAYIAFAEFSEELRTLASTDPVVDEGDLLNISVLKAQCEQKCHQYGIKMTEFNVFWDNDDIPRFTVEFKRLFPDPSDTYKRLTESVWRVKADELLVELDKKLKEHAALSEKVEAPEIVVDVPQKKEEGGEG